MYDLIILYYWLFCTLWKLCIVQRDQWTIRDSPFEPELRPLVNTSTVDPLMSNPLLSDPDPFVQSADPLYPTPLIILTLTIIIFMVTFIFYANVSPAYPNKAQYDVVRIWEGLVLSIVMECKNCGLYNYITVSSSHDAGNLTMVPEVWEELNGDLFADAHKWSKYHPLCNVASWKYNCIVAV